MITLIKSQKQLQHVFRKNNINSEILQRLMVKSQGFLFLVIFGSDKKS